MKSVVNIQKDALLPSVFGVLIRVKRSMAFIGFDPDIPECEILVDATGHEKLGQCLVPAL